ncbi:MAG: tRNA 2-thiocytidine(32) synthetase TtcA [Cytophagales bacterium]
MLQSDKIFLKSLSKEEFKIVDKLRSQVAECLETFALLEEGDKVMVCLSGGKDSYTLLDMMLYFQQKAPINFSIIAVNLDQKQPGFPEHILPEYLSKMEVDYKIVEKDTYSIVVDKVPEGKTMCSLCSRLRRGTLYSVAKEIGATKIALGHHREDVVETFFLNMFFNAKLEAMPAKFKSDNGEHIVIRPLVYCAEKDIEKYAAIRQFPIIPCNLCGSQPNMQRKNVKNMLADWENSYPNRTEIIFKSLQKIHPSHLFDTELYDFEQYSQINTKSDNVPHQMDL